MISRGSGWSRPVLVAVFYLGLAAVGVGWASWRGQVNLWRPAAVSEPHICGGILGGLGLGLLIVFLSRVSVLRFAWARSLHRELRALLGPLTNLEIVVLAGASSLGEEIFFRGAMVPVTGIWVASAAFALLHIGPRRRHLPWTVGSFVAGVLFSLLFIWSGDLTGPVIAHFTVNFLNLRHVASHDLR
jgi:membrane protease YdiL (CAAX protease family)